MFAMMHLRNFRQISIEEVRQAMTRLPVESSALDRNSEGRWLKIRDNWSYAPPVKNFWLRHSNNRVIKLQSSKLSLVCW